MANFRGLLELESFPVLKPRDPPKVCVVEATRGVIVTASKGGTRWGPLPPSTPYLVPHRLPARPKLPRKENITDDTGLRCEYLTNRSCWKRTGTLTTPLEKRKQVFF